MKLLFINLFENHYDKHAIYALSAVVKAAGHDARYISGTAQECMASLKSEPHDVRCYSMFSMHLTAYCEFEKTAREKHGQPSIAGGFGATFAPESGLPFDIVVRGEGEPAIADFLSTGKISERYPFIVLDAMPFPDREIVYARHPVLGAFSSRQFIAGRGCPYDCSYCFNHAYREKFKTSGKYIRRKSVDYMIEEIERVDSRWPFETVVFQDDTFCLDARWLAEWAAKWKRRKPYTCNVRANFITDDVCALLKDSGCFFVNWSFEAAGARLRNDVLCRRMSDKQIHDCALLLRKHGIKFRVAAMVGLPTESMRDTDATLYMAASTGAQYAFANIFTPLPGLKITEYAERCGCLDNRAPLPGSFYERSVLNFEKRHKTYIEKVALLWSLFCWIPALLPLRKVIAALVPYALCRAYFQISNGIVMAAQYRVALRVKLLPDLIKLFRNSI